jgi:hypothetical protein
MRLAFSSARLFAVAQLLVKGSWASADPVIVKPFLSLDLQNVLDASYRDVVTSHAVASTDSGAYILVSPRANLPQVVLKFETRSGRLVSQVPLQERVEPNFLIADAKGPVFVAALRDQRWHLSGINPDGTVERLAPLGVPTATVLLNRTLFSLNRQRQWSAWNIDRRSADPAAFADIGFFNRSFWFVAVRNAIFGIDPFRPAMYAYRPGDSGLRQVDLDAGAMLTPVSQSNPKAEGAKDCLFSAAGSSAETIWCLAGRVKHALGAEVLVFDANGKRLQHLRCDTPYFERKKATGHQNGRLTPALIGVNRETLVLLDRMGLVAFYRSNR